MTNNGGEI